MEDTIQYKTFNEALENLQKAVDALVQTVVQAVKQAWKYIVTFFQENRLYITQILIDAGLLKSTVSKRKIRKYLQWYSQNAL